MSHASHQAHEQARRNKRHADIQDKPAPKSQSLPNSKKHSSASEIKGTAPAAPPKHEDEAFGVFDGSSPQSDG